MSDQKKLSVESMTRSKHKSTEAFVDLNFNGLVIKGYKVVNGQDGLFVSEPSVPGKDKKWYKTVYTENTDLKKEIDKVILEKFKEETT